MADAVAADGDDPVPGRVGCSRELLVLLDGDIGHTDGGVLVRLTGVDELVLAGLSQQAVGTRPARDAVVPVTSEDGVVAVAPVDLIITAEAAVRSAVAPPTRSRAPASRTV